MLLARKLGDLVHQTPAPKHPLLKASRPGELEGLAGHALRVDLPMDAQNVRIYSGKARILESKLSLVNFKV